MFHIDPKDADKVKYLGKCLEIVSQINQKMESLQTKIEELDRWRNMEKNVPSGLPTIKAYDIRLHIVATNECQELAYKFEERAKKSLEGMMNVYDNQLKMSRSIFNGLRSISKMNIQFHFLSFKRPKIHMKLSKWRSNRRN